MKLPLLALTSLLTVPFSCAASLVLAAAPAPPSLEQDAAAKNYIFFPTHDAIVAGAKKEGKLRVSSGLEMPNFKPWMNAFKQRYPFITDIHVEEVVGAEETEKDWEALVRESSPASRLTHAFRTRVTDRRPEESMSIIQRQCNPLDI